MLNYYSSGETFERGGRTFKVFIECDEISTTPWEEGDHLGPVPDYTDRKKRPGEWIIEGRGRYRLYYDAQEAMRQAKRDGWRLNEKRMAALTSRLGRAPTQGEIRAEAVRLDFEYLRRWCEGQWHYAGVIVVHVPDGMDADEVKVDFTHSFWGIQSEDDEYIIEVAHNLADVIAAELDEECVRLRNQIASIRDQARLLIAAIRSSNPLRPTICNVVRERLQAMISERAGLFARLVAIKELSSKGQ